MKNFSQENRRVEDSMMMLMAMNAFILCVEWNVKKFSDFFFISHASLELEVSSSHETWTPDSIRIIQILYYFHMCRAVSDSRREWELANLRIPRKKKNEWKILVFG